MWPESYVVPVITQLLQYLRIFSQRVCRNICFKAQVFGQIQFLVFAVLPSLLLAVSWGPSSLLHSLSWFPRGPLQQPLLFPISDLPFCPSSQTLAGDCSCDYIGLIIQDSIPIPRFLDIIIMADALLS